jgi:hypothetical protein
MAQNEKVIISVELRDKGVKKGLDSAAKASEQAANATKKLTAAEKDENYWASKAGEAEALRAVKTNIAKGRAKELAIETIKLADATKQGRTQTGLNNAILTEAGRVASDAAYGMQGMANNLGQLLTLMSQHAQTKGGFVASMRSLVSSLFGVGGILIGLQLLISYLPQIQDYFDKAAKSAKKLLSAFDSQTESLKFMNKQLFDSNTSLEERNTLLGTLKRTNKELFDLVTKDGKLRKDSNSIFEKYIKLQEDSNKLKDKQKQLSEEIETIEKKEQSTRNAISRENRRINSDRIKEQDRINKILQRGQQLTEKYTEYQLQADGSSLKLTKERIVTEEQYWDTYDYKQREKSRDLEEKLINITAKKNKILKEESILQGRITKARKELGLDEEKREKAKVLFEDKSFKDRLKRTKRFFKDLFKANKENFKIQGELRDTDVEDTRTALQKKLDLHKMLAVDDMKNLLENGKKVVGLAKGFIDSEIQAEEAKTIKINNELRERLNNENLSAEERKKIQLKIAANDAALAKKKDKLAEKQFKIDKALAISSALVNTYNAAVGVMADTKGGFFKRLAAAIPTIAFGLAQVAMISKQKFVPTATTAPALDSGAAGGGATAVQPPSFNIVGSSGVNQLSDAISEAEKQPTRAYVVASDVTTAQELDRNIIESASL